MANKGPKNPERSFGLSVGTVMLLIAAALVWRGRIRTAEIMGPIGAVLVVCGYLQPSLLYWPSKLWWRFALALGYVNARVILTIAFGLVLMPLGMVWRMTGKDPMARRRASWRGWTPYPARYRSSRHFSKMY